MRANACWPLGDPGCEVEAAISAVETWFQARGLPPRFKVTDGAMTPEDLPARLSRRGYDACKATVVMTGPVIGAPDDAVVMSSALDSRFEAVFTASAGGNLRDAHERLEILGRLPAPARFAALNIAGTPAALGACVIEDEWVGVFGMRTAPEHRRKGLAGRAFGALLAEAARLGAHRAYLQVEAENAPALALYRREGFETAYAYSYWVR